MEGGKDYFRKRPNLLCFTQRPVQRALMVVFTEAKRPERRADLSCPSRAVVRNEWSYTPTPPGRQFWKLTLLPSSGKMWDPP